ncbi:MAG TPA: hypothetical protein VKU41_15365 [Polyangiaceae bacterium]|nr:hypothetical protein [Polyangiaceae bacterium]
MATRTLIRCCEYHLGLFVAAASGLCCSGSEPLRQLGSSGMATFRWTVEEALNPELCEHHAAISVEIDVYTRQGQYIERITRPCPAFSTAVSLNEGGYSAELRLVGVDGSTVATPLAIPFDVQRGHAIYVDTDFAKICFPESPGAAN